jgi:hypothetical protein
MARFSGRPLLISWVRAWVEVGCSGGEIRLGSGYFLFDVGPNCGLIVFGAQQVMASRLQDDRTSGFSLCVQGVQTDETALQVQRGGSVPVAPRESRWSWYPPSPYPGSAGWAR